MAYVYHIFCRNNSSLQSIYFYFYLYDKSREVLENLFTNINRRFDMQMSTKMKKEITESCLL